MKNILPAFILALVGTLCAYSVVMVCYRHCEVGWCAVGLGMLLLACKYWRWTLVVGAGAALFAFAGPVIALLIVILVVLLLK